MSETPDLARMREVAEKATLIKQRADDDCTICAIAMAVGQPYEAVMGAATRAEHGYRFRDIPGTASPMAVLAELGIAAKRIASEVLSLNVWNRVLWGRRAILSVPSLNGFEGHHDVYWDGKILHDPTNATPYAADALSSTKPLSAVVLDERAAQRPLLDRIAELEGERDSWKAHAEHHFGHMRAALDLSYALRYPADPTLLDLIANEITCDDRCENAWREHDTNASGCTKSDSEEGCAWEKAQALRDLAKAIRDQAWLLAFSPPSPALAAEAQVSALQAQVDGLREAVRMLNRYDAPLTDDADGSDLTVAGRIEALVYRKAVEADAKVEALVKNLRIVEPYLDAVICYASDVNEHPPNGAVIELRALLSQPPADEAAKGEG